MSTNIHTRARQPQGRPTGGQFAEETKAASGIALDASGQAPACATCDQPTETGVDGSVRHLTLGGQYDHDADTDHEALVEADHPTWSGQQVEDFVESTSDHLVGALDRFEVAEREVDYVFYPTITGDHEQDERFYPDDVDGDYDEDAIERLRQEYSRFVTDHSHLIDAALRLRPDLYGQRKAKVAEDFMASRTRGTGEGFAYRSMGRVGERLHAAADAYPDVRPRYDHEDGVIDILEVPKGTNPHQPYLD